MSEISVLVLLTCYNRCELTLRALKTIDDKAFRIDYLIVDDNSTDGTRDALREWDKPKAEGDEENLHRESEGELKIIKGSGSLYWAGGMRKGMDTLLQLNNNAGKKFKDGEKILRVNTYDYLLLINDDVEFYPFTLSKMIERSREKGDMPVTGATKGSAGKTSYGGVLYDMKRAKQTPLDIGDADKCPVDTMNCNAFLMPWDIFSKAGSFDPNYVHSLADYDYGFRLKGMGYKVWLTDFYVGECDDNETAGTWRDVKLKRMERLRKKESVKGLPRKQWYYYLKKNFGLRAALWHSITPYLRIILGI